MATAKAGRVALFRGKLRERPLTVTLTPRHWHLLEEAAERLVLTRADLVGLLIHRYARTVQLPATLRTDDDDE
jgi:hypothetical protein